jgi:hypothetical protein
VLLVQFTLRRMMVWTMILAVYLAFVRLTYDSFAWYAGQSRINVCRRPPINGPVSHLSNTLVTEAGVHQLQLTLPKVLIER